MECSSYKLKVSRPLTRIWLHGLWCMQACYAHGVPIAIGNEWLIVQNNHMLPYAAGIAWPYTKYAIVHGCITQDTCKAGHQKCIVRGLAHTDMKLIDITRH